MGDTRRIAERYDVLDLLGRGAAAEVHRVRDTLSGEERALKILRPEGLANPDALAEAMGHEFRILAGLSHPHLVQVHDYGVLPAEGDDPAFPWYTMDLVEGAPIDRALGHPGDWTTLARVSDALLDALGAIHEVGLVHHDVTSANILLSGDPAQDPPRVWLMDLGLAGPFRQLEAGVIRGTPATLAPETLRGGSVDGRADLYSFGCVLYALVTGEDPFRDEDPWRVLRAHLETRPTPPSHLNPDVPRGLETLILDLMQKDPAARPATAHDARRALAPLSGRKVSSAPPLARALQPTFSGRERELEIFREALGRTRDGEGSVLLVVGPSGSGRSRLAAELALAARLENRDARLVPARDAEGRPFGLADALAPGAEGPPETRASRAAAELARREGVLIVDDAESADGASRAMLVELAARLASGGRPGVLVLVLAEAGARSGGSEGLADSILERGAGRLLRLKSLDAPSASRMVASMLGRTRLPGAWGPLILERASGHPMLIQELARRLVASGRIPSSGELPTDPRALFEDLSLDDPRSHAWLQRALTGLDERARRSLAALALPGGAPLDLEDFHALIGDEDLGATLDALVASGLVRRRRGRGARLVIQLATPALASALLEEFPSDALAPLHRLWAQRLEARRDSEASRARHLRAAGNADQALPLFVAAAESALTAGLPVEAQELAEEGLELARQADERTSFLAPLRRLRAAGLKRRGFVDDARAELESALAEVAEEGRQEERAAVLLDHGVLLGELGEIPNAQQSLEDALALLDELADTEGGARVLLQLAHLFAGEGRVPEAEARLNDALSQARRAGRAALEVDALLALGELALESGSTERAEEHYSEAEAVATSATLGASGSAARRGRVLVMLARGRAQEALDEAGAWTEDARQAGNRFEQSRADLLKARALAALGKRAEAIATAERAAELFRSSGRRAETVRADALVATLLAERGMLRVALEKARGALAGAERTGDAASLGAARKGLATAHAALGHVESVETLLPRLEGDEDHALKARAERSLLLGIALLRADQPERAREVLQETCFLARRLQRSVLETQGLIGLAEAYLDLREDERAELALRRVERAAEGVSGSEETLALARLLSAERELARPDGAVQTARDHAARALEVLEERERGDLSWRAASALHAALRRQGERGPETSSAFERAASSLDALLAGMPDADRARWRQRARVASVLEQQAKPIAESGDAVDADAREPAGASPELATRVGELERMLAINRSLNSVLDLPALLRLMLDTAIDLCGAERAFVLLDVEGRTEVEVARGLAGADLPDSESALSRSVARRTMRENEPLLAHDAMQDERLAQARSVHDLKIRSVLACPLRVRGECVGAIVLDSRRAADLFGRREETLLTQLADQAGIAIGNARLVAELRRQAEEIRGLNERLSQEVEEQRVEILEKQSNLELRYRYDCIIGASPPMQRLYRALEKLLPTEIPVLVTGESGTGKDLVARVLHYNGPRKDKRFVTVNCAALTDTLLESELFGHRKGAYTGADRDRRGLFEQADGGTLFLDEMGDLPLHLQPKLLRALQFGEIRRVGEDTPRRVNVRIVAATNRDLMQRVDEGLFREDLLYRLDVGRVHLEPLRERLEDLGLLVDHFLAELAEGSESPPLKVEPAALRLFLKHDWPGNVRELHNEVTRLGTFTEGETITELDVLENASFLARGARGAGSPGARSGEPASVPGPGDPVETLEEAELKQIRQALRTAKGNRTRAAQLLGIDRSTLYRKLKRYGED